MTELPGLSDLLNLERVDTTRFRTTVTVADGYGMFGGQYVAQALRAAGLTVPNERRPHSLHGYFLRAADPRRQVDFTVEADLDGGRFSSRRVLASQDGHAVFSATASFQDETPGGPHQQAMTPTTVDLPDSCAAYTIPRVRSFEGRSLPQEGTLAERDERYPTRYWARSTDPTLAADPLRDACAIAYISDFSSGTAALVDEGLWPGPSIDHAIWFHAPGRSADWLLIDMTPLVATFGRGTYTGSITDLDGRLVASFAQEALMRESPMPANRTTGEPLTVRG